MIQKTQIDYSGGPCGSHCWAKHTVLRGIHKPHCSNERAQQDQNTRPWDEIGGRRKEESACVAATGQGRGEGCAGQSLWSESELESAFIEPIAVPTCTVLC